MLAVPSVQNRLVIQARMQRNGAQLSKRGKGRATHILNTCTSSPVAIENLIVGLQLNALHHSPQLRRMALQALSNLLDTTANGLGREALELIFFYPPQHKCPNGATKLLAQTCAHLITLIVVSREDRFDPGIPIGFPPAQESRLRSVHQTPKVTQTVFYWRPCGQ